MASSSDGPTLVPTATQDVRLLKSEVTIIHNTHVAEASFHRKKVHVRNQAYESFLLKYRYKLGVGLLPEYFKCLVDSPESFSFPHCSRVASIYPDRFPFARVAGPRQALVFPLLMTDTTMNAL